jgi:hypothetical protein
MSESAGTKLSKISDATAITRRTFAAGAAAALGSMILEPIANAAFGNTYALPGPTKAYGVEVRTVTVEHGKFCVMVYNPTSLDITIKDGKQVEYAQPVRNAAVIVHNYDKNVDKKVFTDDKGCAVFDLKDIADKKSSKMLGDYWEFAGSVQIFQNGYREVYYPCVQFADAMAVAIPEIEDTSRIGTEEQFDVYFRTISMDGWNVQYQTQEFIGCEENTSEHELYVEFFSKNGGAFTIQPVIYKSNDQSRVGMALADAQTIECSLSSPLLGQDNYSNSWKYGKATFKGDFFNANSGKFINTGEQVRLIVSDPTKQGDATKLYSQSTGISCCGTPCQGGRQDGNTIISLATNYKTTEEKGYASQDTSGGLVRPQGNSFTLNGKWPGKMGNITLDMWTPNLPVIFKYDPIGRFVLGVDLQFLEYNNLPAAPGGKAQWHKTSRESLNQQWDRKLNEIKRGWNTLKDYKPKAASYKPNSSYSFIDFSLRFQALLDMKYKQDQNCWDGNVRAVVGGAFSISYTAPFTFLFFPMYAKIAFDADLSLAVSGFLHSSYSETYTDGSTTRPSANIINVLKNAQFSNEASISPTFHAKLTGTLAVGADKLASAGIRASGGISVTWMFFIPKRDGKKDPRFIFGYEYGIEVFAEILIFTTSRKLWGDANATYYDSDKENNTSKSALKSGNFSITPAVNEASSADSTIDLDEFGIVTSETLEALAEVTISTSNSQATVASVAAMKVANEENTPLEINDFTVCGAEAAKEEICATELSASSTSSSSNNEVMLLADNETQAESSYSWPTGHESSPDDRGSGSDIIMGLAKNGGVKPRRMDLVAKDAYLAPSSKLVEIYNSKYLFRTATVSIDGVVRNRLVYQRIEDGSISKPFPVEFQDKTPGADSRADFYDYAFDIKLVNKQKDYADVVLMVLSGKRPSDDKTSIYSAAEATVLNVVRLVYNSEASADKGCFEVKSCRTWSSPTYENSKKYFAFTNPHLQTRRLTTDEDGFNRLSTDGYEHALGYFIINAAASKEDLLSPENDNVQVGLGILHLSVGNDSDELQVTSLSSMGQNIVSTAIDTLMAHPSEANSLYCSMGYKTKAGCGAKALKLAFETADGRSKLSAASAIDIINTDPKVKSLNPWNTKNALLAAVSTHESVSELDQNGYLALCSTPDKDQIQAIENGSGKPGTFDKENSCISPTDVPLGNVHVDATHEYCYFPSNHDGKGFYNYDEEGNATAATEDPQFAINAIAMADGVFTSPFVLADCGENYVDTFCVVEDTSETNSTSSHFVTCSITNFDTAAANLYSFNVPFLASISVDDLTLTDAVVHAGDSITFSVTLTNTGNTVMTKAVLHFFINNKELTELPELELCFDDAENGDDYLEYDFDYETDYMSDATKKNILVNEYGDAALAPGQTRTFLFEVPTQESWEGECTLVANIPSEETTIYDPCTNEIIAAKDSKHIASFESTDANTESETFTIAGEEEVEPYYDEDLPDDIDDYDDDDGGSSNGSGNGNGGSGDGGDGSGADSKSSSARTADPFTAAGPLAAALAAAGAGLAAYSARRTRLENGEINEDEE